MDQHWANVDECLDKVRLARTVDQVILVLNEHFAPSAGNSFFGGDAGEIWDALESAGWQIIWSAAEYHFVAQDPSGQMLTYTEGDVDRGDQRPR